MICAKEFLVISYFSHRFIFFYCILPIFLIHPFFIYFPYLSPSVSLSPSLFLSLYLSIYLSNPLSFSFLSLFLFYPSEPTSTSFPIGMMNGRGKASGPDQTLDQESQMRLAKLKSEDEEMDKGLDDISHTIDNLTNIAGDMNAEVSIY